MNRLRYLSTVILLLGWAVFLEPTPSAAESWASGPLHTESSDDSSPSLTGSWVGRWKSCSTGHQGPLAATFCQIAPDRYQVAFKGRFFKIIPFRYSVELRVVRYEGNRLYLAGAQKLGPVMGVFTYSAWVSEHEFRAQYKSKNDSGWFTLHKQTL